MRVIRSAAWFSVLGAVALAAPAQAEGLRPTAARSTLLARRAPLKGALPAQDRAALDAGETVSRPMVFERNGGRYIGGVAYQIVRAKPEEVLRALATPSELPRLLPRTKSARLVDGDREGVRVELTQGTSIVEATYTVHVKRVGTDELHFKLDASRPHGIDDVWGYIRARPVDDNRTLITVAVALDVGPGIVRMLFEEKIQRAILATPRQIKDALEPKTLARLD